MKLIYFKGEHPNFGDDLNLWLWPKLLPEFFDDDDRTVFIGIGSIIGMHRFAPSQKKIVFGSGFVQKYIGNGPGVPNLSTEEWHVFFVRGPRTAKRLGLDPALGIGDAAILVREVVTPLRGPGNKISFMPHWESRERGHWDWVCKIADVNMIDPRQPVEEIIAEIQGSKILLTEAMHGAIVADALRVPWIPLLPINHVHREKWLDWAESLNITLRPRRLWPSSLLEAVRYQAVRKAVTRLPFKGFLDGILSRMAAWRLRALTRAQGQLSEAGLVERAHALMMAQLHRLQDRYGRQGQLSDRPLPVQ